MKSRTRSTYCRINLVALLCVVMVACSGQVVAQLTSRSTSQPTSGRNSSTASSTIEADRGRVPPANANFTMHFRRTELDTKAEGVAQVEVGKGRLLVRVQANNLPLPSRWRQQHYSVWVYLPNYGYKMYIGDLPVEKNSNEEVSEPARNNVLKDILGAEAEKIERGNSDTRFIFNNMPPDAVFGGLILTAEPPRYGAIINEPLRPVLIAVAADGDIEVGALEDRAIKRIAPVFSDVARRARTIGKVKVFIEIDNKGNVMTVGKTSGPILLRECAVNAVRQWKFQPIEITGQRVRAKGYVEFVFDRQF